ncbi:MAG: hypothetical protein ACTMIK_11260 [Galactobacter sp.]
MKPYAYGAAAGTDKATILKLRSRVAYLEHALQDALAIPPKPTSVTLNHPAAVRHRLDVPAWNRIDWTSPEARASIQHELDRVHARNQDPPGAGRIRLAVLDHETLEHKRARARQRGPERYMKDTAA